MVFALAAAAAAAMATVVVGRALPADACRAGDASCAAMEPAREQVLMQLKRTKGQQGRCAFVVEPETPYYWDVTCTVGKRGCWADGVNPECRFCGYEGIECPKDAEQPFSRVCRFDNPPKTKYYFEPRCPHVDKGLGCKADGRNQGCRFCGGTGAYQNITCPRVEGCTFANEPTVTPYYYEERCVVGMLGCLADGIHRGCRFCGARPYQSIPCPREVAVPDQACYFRNEPHTPYFWDETCRMGKLGCWADGIHEQCRFCSKTPGKGGVYSSIKCPGSTETDNGDSK